MKKFKKVFAVLLTLAMVLGMSITSFAAPLNGASLKVEGLSTAGAQTVKIYLLYELDNDNNLWKRASWATALPEEVADGEELEELKNADILAALKTASASVSESAKKDDIVNGSFTFNNLQAGAYLVVATDSTNRTTYGPMVGITYTYGTDGLMKSVTTSDEINANKVVAKPESIKTYKGQKVATDDQNSKETDEKFVEVGDLIEYTIKETVPALKAGETTGTFKITDTLTGGTYIFSGEAVKGITPKFSITTANTNFTIEEPTPVENADGSNSFEIDLSELVTSANTYAGTEVVITYTVRVDQVDSVTNTALTDRGNDVESESATTTAKTGQITITKKELGTNNNLNGASFAVYRMNGSAKEYAYIDNNGYVAKDSNGNARWMTESEFTALDNYTGVVITTSNNGTAVIKGLGAGTYYFQEVVAPDGYSINENDVNATLSATLNDSGVIISTSGNTSMDDTRLGSLPSTGGIGTTIFTIGGCAIMIIAAALFFASRRKAAK